MGAVVIGRVDLGGAERESIGDGVEAAVTEGVAAQQPPAGKEESPGYAEAIDGFHGISGAGRLVPAAAGKSRGYPALVPPDRRQGKAFHVERLAARFTWNAP